MKLGKILGFAALGVTAVAAAPFTGGMSMLVATTVGAGTAATGAGVIGAGIGKLWSDKEEREEAIEKEIVNLNIKVQKYEKEFTEAIERFKGDKEYFNYIIGSTAIGISMANADGEISEEERIELEEFIGGIANSNYPQHIKDIIQDLYDNPPSFNAAIEHLEKVDPSNYESIKDMLELVMEADGAIHEKEKAFLSAFKSNLSMIDYNRETEDDENQFLLEIQEKIVNPIQR